MHATLPNIEDATLGLYSIEQYEPLIGADATRRIQKKAEALRGRHVVHISSTLYGGGVAEILTPLTLLMNATGIKTGWRVIQGTPAFFSCTKKLHNALQGQPTTLSEEEKAIYERIVSENAVRLHIEGSDAVIVHDPQPLPLIAHFKQRDMPWFWQCHVDLSAPDRGIWNYLRSFVEQYNSAIVSLREYEQGLSIPQHFVTPAINPFSAKNRELSEREISECLAHYQVPTDRPLVVQISRFDHWKDPLGVIEAFHLARKEVDCVLLLVGNKAVDDPEGDAVFESIRRAVDDGIIVLAGDDPILVNALQRHATVVLQKSIREGFGLTVTEAMWKGNVVIGGNVGGIKLQIEDGKNGFLVDSVEQAAQRIVQVLKDPHLRGSLGTRARESVRQNFLLSRLMEDWIDLVTASLHARSAQPARLQGR